MTGQGVISAGAVLFGTRPAAVRSLGRSLHNLGAAESGLRGVRQARAALLQPVDDQIADAVTSQLDHDLGMMLLEGWHHYRALRRAADTTLAKPESEEDVELASHQVTATRHPRADVLVDGSCVYTFAFDLEAEFELTSVAAVVRNGCLVALRGGDCHLNVTLRLGDHTLATREVHVDLAVLLRLDGPVPLTQEAARRLRLHSP